MNKEDPMDSTVTAESKPAKEMLRERATTVKDDIRELGRVAKDAAKDTAGQYIDQTKQKYGEIEDQVVNYIREQPVKSVLIAAGTGLLLGLLFTRR